MVRVGGGGLDREIGRAAQLGVGRQTNPGGGRRASKGGSQWFAHNQTLVRIGHALIIAFGQGEPARLIEVILRRRKLLQIIARFSYRAIAAGGAK